MRIGILAGEIPPPHFIHQLVCNMAERDHKVFLYGSIKEKNFRYYNSSIYLRVKPENKVNVFLTAILLIIKLISIYGNFSLRLLAHILRQEKRVGTFIKRCCIVLPPFLDNLDIFHIQWAKTLVHYPEFIEKLTCPIVLSLRGTHINVSPISNEVFSLSYKKYFPRINGFHAVSQAIAEEAEKYGADINKITVINPAVDEKLLNYKADKVNNLDSEILHIISVGRCHWIKGYTFVLDAMSILSKEKVDFNYTIIAGGRDQENILYQIHDLGLNECVSFINDELSHDEVLKKVSECDLFLLPSLEEGISNAVIEAMALGLPVISTDCGGMGEIIKNGENGFLVPVRDADSMAGTIQNFLHLDEKNITKIIQNAREKIRQNHLLPVQIERFKSLYRNIL